MNKVWGLFGPVMGLSAVLVRSSAAAWSTPTCSAPAGARSSPSTCRSAWPRSRSRRSSSPASARSTRLDLGGVALAGAGTLMLVYPLVQGRELGWPAWVCVMLAGSLPALALFAAHQLRRKRAGAPTLVEPSVFAKRSYVSGIAFAVFFFGALGGIMLTLGILLQVGLGYSPIGAALTMAPWAFGAILGSGLGGAMMHKLGRTILHASSAWSGRSRARASSSTPRRPRRSSRSA
jgi:hypothetical protein